MAARELRYQWFDALCEQLEFDFILTAHHADDNLETFLINLSRGAGIEGLTGIPEINDRKVRPLLKFSRIDIENYAKSHNLKWREDKSNSSKKYIRNKLRHEVIPILKEINPQLLNNFRKTLDHLKDSKQIIEDRIDQVSDDIINVKKDGIYLNINRIQLLNNPKAYLYEMLKSFQFTEWDDVYNLLSAQSGKQIFSENWRLLKDRKELILTKKTIEESYSAAEVADNTIVFKEGCLLIEKVSTTSKNSPSCIYLDADKLRQPFKVRNFEKGDMFHPEGMRGKKKISKYYKDEKMSLVEKENVFLLCSGEDIVWVINKRADGRFLVTDETKNILKISYSE
jgi:tRNA(Ile)-lysidine synthase